MGDQSRGAMPGERPPGNRKPGQNRGPRNGAGPSSSHSGGATSFTAKQKEDISTIRAFGIEEDKLTDEQIVSHMQSTKCRTEQLIDEFYTKGGLAEEFHTVASKQEKKAAQPAGRVPAVLTCWTRRVPCCQQLLLSATHAAAYATTVWPAYATAAAAAAVLASATAAAAEWCSMISLARALALKPV